MVSKLNFDADVMSDNVQVQSSKGHAGVAIFLKCRYIMVGKDVTNLTTPRLPKLEVSLEIGVKG